MEIDGSNGGDHVVGLGGEEVRDGVPALLLVFAARQRVLEIELHTYPSTSIFCRVSYRSQGEKGKLKVEFLA